MLFHVEIYPPASSTIRNYSMFITFGYIVIDACIWEESDSLHRVETQNPLTTGANDTLDDKLCGYAIVHATLATMATSCSVDINCCWSVGASTIHDI